MKKILKKVVLIFLSVVMIHSTFVGVLTNAESTTEVSEIRIIGPAKIADYTFGGVNTYNYRAVAMDANGEILPGYNITLSLGQDAPQNVSLSGNVLTVTGDLGNDKHFTLYANSSVATAEKTITTLDRKTYEADEARLGIALKYAEKVLEVGTDKTGNTPLIADGVDVYSGEFATWNLPAANGLPAETVAMSNLASQVDLMKGLVALSKLTGIPKYQKRVEDIYSYYIDNYIDPTSGMVYWGGHTTINLNTGLRANSSPDANIHELKTHLPYLDPFFAINPEVGKRIVKSSWSGHVTDFSNLLFSRHAKYLKTYDVEGNWNNLDRFDEKHNLITVTRSELPFKNAANDLIYFACKMYQQTGDRQALVWAQRLLGRYTAIRNPETKLGGTQFTTSSCPESKAALEAFEKKVGMKWYELPPDHDLYPNRTFSSLGDRAENQFADFAGNGYLPENPDYIREYNLVAPDSNYGSGALADMLLAESFGLDTAEGQQVLRDCAEGMASWAHLAYVPETNMFKALWTDGTDMTGYVVDRGGYYYDKGEVVKGTRASSDYLLSYSKMYFASSALDGFEDERDEIWQLARSVAKARGLGELGVTKPGDNINVNFNIYETDPILIYALCELYSHTGISDYLNLARRIADHIIDEYYNNGYFMLAGKKYAQFDSQHFYALLILDASIRGEMDLVDDLVISESFYSANYVRENGKIDYKTYDNTVIWPIMTDVKEYEIYNNEFDYGLEYDGYDITNVYGWNKNDSVTAVVSKTPDMPQELSYEAANKALRVTSASNDGYIYKNITDANNIDVSVDGVAKYSVRVLPCLGSGFEISFDNMNEEKIAEVKFESGDIYANDIKVSEYTVGEWVNITAQIDKEKKMYCIYIGNKKVVDNVSGSSMDTVVRKITFDLTQGTELYIDNLSIKSNKKPDEYIDFPFELISSESQGYVTKNLDLINSYTDKNGIVYSVKWKSNNTSAISNSGVVYRGNKHKTAELTATITNLNTGGAIEKKFYVLIAPEGTTLVSEDFQTGTENQDIRKISSGKWYLYRTVDSIDDLPLQSTVVKDPTADANTSFDSQNKVLLLHRVAKASTNERPRKAVDTESEGDLVVRTRVYFDESSNRCSINLLNSKKQVIAMVGFKDYVMRASVSAGGGTIINQDGSDVVNAYTHGSWIDVVLTLDTKTRTYDVYLDGEKMNPVPYEFFYGPDVQPDNYAGDSLAFLEFDIKKELATESKWYIDDIEAIELADYTPGDVNGDSSVNATDVTVLTQFVAGWNAQGINTDCCDVNGDGSVNATDVTILMQRVAGWNVGIS